MLKRVLTVLIFLLVSVFAAALQLNTLSGIEQRKEECELCTDSQQKEHISDVMINAAVLYCKDDTKAASSLTQLENSTLASMTCSLVCCDDGVSAETLSCFDVVYPDESVMCSPFSDIIRSSLCTYVENGGNLFLSNGFISFFDGEFLGIGDKVKVTGVPKELVNDDKDGELSAFAQIVTDFSQLYGKYKNADVLSLRDYGYAAKTTTAKSIVSSGSDCLYGLNKVGNGTVLFTNPLLPNDFSINSFHLTKDDHRSEPFAETTAAANTLLKSEYASFVSKQKYGFSVKRTFGSFAGNPISWQLHFEEITGFENNSGVEFSELCKEYDQIPSFTLVRNTYKWFAKYETVGYQKFDGSKAELDLYENAYSNGVHVMSGDSFLSLSEIDNTGSYFADYPDQTQRLGLCIYDLDSDGNMDFVCGSSDGYVYFFKGLGFSGGRFRTSEKQKLYGCNNEPIYTFGYSFPCVFDADKDGVRDLVCGSADASVILYRGTSDPFVFSEGKVLFKADGTNSMPSNGDVNADGLQDLAVGTRQGKVYLYFGTDCGFSQPQEISEANTKYFASPYICDLDGNGSEDMLVGDFDGYVRKVYNTGGGWQDGGYVLCTEKNYKGNYRVKFGNNCTPRLFDIDGDKIAELVCGYLEYGLCVPIDSAEFPYRNQLQSQLDYMKKNHFYVGAHFLTGEYASKEREKYELSAQKAALSSYGIETDCIGLNQHTWFTSEESPTQSIDSAKNAGFLWNSGSQSSRSKAVPQASYENVLTMPAFTSNDRSFMLLQPGTLLYLDDELADLTAKYFLPMLVYYHCDFTHNDNKTARETIERVGAFAEKNDYSFVSEKQLVKAAAASSNLLVKVKLAENGFTLSADTKAGDFPLYDDAYAKSTGVRIELSKETCASEVMTDASVWELNDNVLSVGLDKTVSVSYEAPETKNHITSINLPASVDESKDGAVVTFAEDGLLRVVTEYEAATSDEGWKTVREGDKTVFTKFGKAQTLHISYVG